MWTTTIALLIYMVWTLATILFGGYLKENEGKLKEKRFGLYIAVWFIAYITLSVLMVSHIK